MKKQKVAQGYRADRRNAAREAGTLGAWRNRPRIRTALKGTRSQQYIEKTGADGKPVYATRYWSVFTCAAGI